jgi:hypothetical protein
MLRAIIKHSKGYVLFAGLAALAGTFAPHANAQKVTPIDSCGAVLTTPGVYTVQNPLTSTSDSTDCIQINGSGILLELQANLTGPGGSGVTAAGIHVTANAKSVGIAIAGVGQNTVTIQGFGNGILVEGTGVTMSGGYNTYQLQGNAAQGVLVQNASNVVLNSLNSISNAASGLEIINSSGVTVLGSPNLSSNGGHGLWVNGATASQFYNVQALQNGGDGIYIGTSGAPATEELSQFVRPKQPKGCLGCLSSSAVSPNVVIGAQVSGNKGPGIVIDAGQTGFIVSGSMGASNGTADAMDKNNNCTANTWSENIFETVSPSCIH